MKGQSALSVLPWTGERYIPEISGILRLEHIHRYTFARQFVEGRTVLDIACGEGYGSDFLARQAARVIGVDISSEAVSHAAERYHRENLEFKQGSCSDIPLPDASVDVVVSFETIEHHQQHQEMMSEIRRVLRPDGIVVISSPEKHEYSDVTGQKNIFHVKELYRDEFEALIQGWFAHQAIFGQRAAYGSAIFLESGVGRMSSNKTDEQPGTDSVGIDRPQYLIAVASNAPLPEVTSSFCEQPISESEFARQSNELLAKRDQQIVSLGQSLQERDRRIADLLEEVRRGEAKALSLTSQLEEARVAVAALRSSTSWRITRPMRMLKRLVCPAASGGGPLWSALRYIYHNLPIEAAHQNQLKDRAYRAFPSIFRHLRSYEIWSNRQRLFDQMAPAATQPESPIALKPIVPEEIFLATSSQPLVSVIIPVYGKIDYTLRCLYSLARNKPNAPFEVVVVDDKSPDDTLAMLSRVKGVRVAANEVNSGFIRSCNLGAAEARGDYLCFLNNDTEVMPGWLDELVGSFDGFSNVGLVGSKLVYPNGRLQEAGSIIWNDGSAWNFGRDQDPTSPEYNYAREVDYCSGASILLKKALFDELGGFDELYLPAYCEDDDLALKIRSRGMKVIYQPLSVVVHYEGVTSGTDTSSGAKAYQIENTQKLYGRWKDLLSSNQPPGIDVDKAKDRGVTQRALVLDSCTPTPDQDAGSNFTYNLLLSLRQAGIHTTFIPEDNFLYMPCYTPALQRAGIEVLYAPHVTSVRQHLSERGGRYDLVIIIRPVVAERCLDAVRQFCPKAKVVYHAADVHFLRMQREAELLGDPVKGEAARKMKDSELKLMASVDAVSVHSPVEQDLIRAHLPQIPVCLFRWVMPVRGTQSAYEKRRDIVFIGGYQHPPNVDAAVYFINEVLPLVKSVLPEVRFIAVGSNPPASLMALAANDVLVPGYVEDLASMLDGIRVAVAPLRYGAGIKGKIATTLSVGLPCVATSMAAEGMGLTNGEDILIADGPEALADAIVRLYREETLWRAVSEKGLIFAERTYGTGASETAIRNILETVGLKAPEGAFIRKLVSPTSFQNCTASPSSVCRDES